MTTEGARNRAEGRKERLCERLIHLRLRPPCGGNGVRTDYERSCASVAIWQVLAANEVEHIARVADGDGAEVADKDIRTK